MVKPIKKADVIGYILHKDKNEIRLILKDGYTPRYDFDFSEGARSLEFMLKTLGANREGVIIFPENIKELQEKYIFDNIVCMDYDEQKCEEIELTDKLTPKGQLQFVAEKAKGEYFTPYMLNKCKNDPAKIFDEYLRGLPSSLSVAAESSEILEVGNYWGVDLSSEAKESTFITTWYPMIAKQLVSMMKKHDIDIMEDVGEIEYKSEEQVFYETLKSLALQDDSPRIISGSGPFANEYAVPATSANIEALKSIELFVHDTIQRCDNKDHHDFGQNFCFFSGPKMEDIEAKLEEILNGDCADEVAELLGGQKQVNVGEELN